MKKHLAPYGTADDSGICWGSNDRAAAETACGRECCRVKKQKEAPYQKQLYLGLGAVIAIALSCFVLSMNFFDNPRFAAPCLYNAGVDVLGTLVCAVLFYGCMSQTETSTVDFISLITLTSLSFFNNAWSWFIMGVPRYRTAYLILCSLTKLMDFGLTYHFYSYVRKNLAFDGRLARWADRLARLLLIPAVLMILINLFVPFCFSVDAEGMFHEETLFRLIDLYLIVLIPLAAWLIVRAQTGRQQKVVALSFIVTPVLHYIITGGAFGYATQYGATLVALVMIYCVLFTERGKKLASTQTELQTARGIQNGMLPHSFPPFPDRKEFSLYAVMDPAREVGGDFYDFFLIDSDHLCLVIADVSGKGVPAALFMMLSKVILESCAILGQSAAETLRQTNEAICAYQMDMFVTVWLGILEISTGKMACANAGHEYPTVRKAEEGFSLFKDPHGFVLGGMTGMKYREYELQLKPGDKLFVYTDGVPEATNAENQLFGTDRLLAALNENPDAEPEQLLANVRKAIDRFVKDAEQFDDLTMLCLDYQGPSALNG